MMKRDNQIRQSRELLGWRRDAAPPRRSHPLTCLRRRDAAPPRRSHPLTCLRRKSAPQASERLGGQGSADLRRRQVTERCPGERRGVPTMARHPFSCRSCLLIFIIARLRTQRIANLDRYYSLCVGTPGTLRLFLLYHAPCDAAGGPL